MSDVIARLKQQGLLPLFFHKDAQVCEGIVRALYDGGIRIIEFTNRGAEALDNFAHLRRVRDASMPGLLLAAGTIKTGEQAEDFIKAGADIIISPGLNEEVGSTVGKNIPWVPGCMTPSEIMKAERAGAKLIKLFPGNLLGPGFMDAIRELFPELSFIPTGGVKMEKENLSAWFKSGVIAVGAGSTLLDKKAIERLDYDAIRNATTAALQLIAEARK